MGLFISIISIYQKINEALIKEKFRQNNNENYSTKSAKWFLGLFTILFTSPIFIYYDIAQHYIWLIIFFAIIRMIPVLYSQKIKAEFKDTSFQKNTTLTLYENFISPIVALFVFGIILSFENEISIFYYLLTPFIGVFLLWALREEKFTMTTEIKQLFLTSFYVSFVETLLIYFSIKYADKIILNSYLDSELEKSYILFLMIISISMISFVFYFYKDFKEERKRESLIYNIKNGFIHTMHDMFHFMFFIAIGPIYLMVRRGFMIPLQNLYLTILDKKGIRYIIKRLQSEPLLKLRGGKDFIISFVDFIFNRVVKYIITLLG